MEEHYETYEIISSSGRKNVYDYEAEPDRKCITSFGNSTKILCNYNPYNNNLFSFFFDDDDGYLLHTNVNISNLKKLDPFITADEDYLGKAQYKIGDGWDLDTFVVDDNILTNRVTKECPLITALGDNGDIIYILIFLQEKRLIYL